MDFLNTSHAQARQTFGFVGEVALLVVDAQKEFADPAKGRGNEITDRVAARIAATAPAFRDAGVAVYAVHDMRNEKTPVFHEFEPAAQDTLCGKFNDSAFKNTDLAQQLQRDGKKLLLIAGFNASGCAYETARDAKLAGFEVAFLADLAADDDFAALDQRGQPAHRYAVGQMNERGIALVESSQVLDAIRTASAEMTGAKLAEHLKNVTPETLPDTLCPEKPNARAMMIFHQNYMGR